MLKTRIFEAIRRNPLTTSQLAVALGADAIQILRVLADMETSGQVVRLPDGTWAIASNRTVQRRQLNEFRVIVL